MSQADRAGESGAARWAAVNRVLDLAFDTPPDQRPALLDRECAGDLELRAEVEALLAGAEADVFFDSPALDIAGSMLSTDLAIATPLEGSPVGVYRLVREIGRGGMGVVWLAERADGHFEQRVALKLIRRGMDSDEILRRFLAERQVLARLRHPNIARLLDGGITAEGQPWFAMEYVDGVGLTRYCEEHHLDVDDRLALFQKVCGAVRYAHQNLVVHRDLKPSNILVSAGGEVTLLDFGIAKVLSHDGDDQQVTSGEQRLMTPDYAAPEQVRGEPVTTATDVYALGAILYQLLTGYPPHQLAGLSTAERLRVVCEVEPQPPSTAAPDQAMARRVRGDLDTIVLQALRKAPARRYPTVEALSEDLERHRTGLPVRARADSFAYRSRKFLTRNRLAVGGAAVLFLALAAGLAGTLWQARATAREAAKARAARDFLVGLFRVSQPEESRGREITARELLERGARRIGPGLAREPETQMELLQVLGLVHRDLGLYPEADSLLGRSVALARARYGPAHPELAAKLTDWAGVLTARGEYARAESLLAEAEAVLERAARDDTTMAATLGALADLERRRGNFAPAESLYRRALALDRSSRGDRLRVATDLDRLGLVLEAGGRLPDADSSYAEALALRRELLDADHPDVIASLHHLATLREKQGEFAEAERLAREVLARRRRIYPERHPEIAYAMQGLANTLQIQGSYQEAESLEIEATAILRERLGPDHPETLELARNLATLQYEKGDLAGAERNLRLLHAAWERSLGHDHPTTLGAANDLAAVLMYQGQYEEAERLHREALALRRARLGEVHPDVGESWGNLAELLQRAGKLAEAEEAYRRTVAIYRTALPPGNIYLAGSLLGLGSVLTERGRAAEAEPLLREALRLRTEKLGTADRRTARANRELGVCLAARGLWEEAESSLVQAYRTLAPAKNWYHRRLRQQTAQDLVRLYQRTGRPAEAEAIRAAAGPVSP